VYVFIVFFYDLIEMYDPMELLIYKQTKHP